MKKLQLGKAEVSFSHSYKKDLIWVEKKDAAIDVSKPISTTASITINGKEAVGIAKCFYKDKFTFEKGRKIALEKAIATHPDLALEGSSKKEKKASPAYKERARIWNDYSKLKPGGRW